MIEENKIQRLIELGNSLEGIIRELRVMLDTPDPCPPKRRKSAKMDSQEKYSILLDINIRNKRNKAKSKNLSK